MEKIKGYFLNSYDYLFAILILLLPFSKGIPNIIMAGLLLIFLIDFKKQYFQGFYKSPYLIIFFLTLYLFGQAIINGTFIMDFEFYKKYLYLIIIPILFLRVNNYQLLKITAIVSINATILISLFKILKFYSNFGYLPFNDGWATNFVLVLERPYAGIFSIICIILSFDQIQRKTKSEYLFIASALLSVFFILFIAIRVSILTLFLIFGLYIFFYMKVAFKRKAMFFIVLLISLLLTLAFNKNISKRFFINDSIEKTLQTTKQFEPRIIIYSCAKEITQQPEFSIIFGTNSYTNIENSLVNCYSNSVEDYSRRSWFLEHRFNTHSQFIDLYLIGGLIAIFLFLTFLIKSVRDNYTDFSTVAMIVSFVMILCIENILHRQFGCFIFTIFTALFLNTENSKQNV